MDNDISIGECFIYLAMSGQISKQTPERIETIIDFRDAICSWARIANRCQCENSLDSL